MSETDRLVQLSTEHPLWERFFCVFPLVLIGTREPDGTHDLAPKHMAMPLSWQNYFGFVCTERHATLQNVRRTGVFTVSFLRPSHMLDATLAASPRDANGQKPLLQALDVFPASAIDGVLAAGCDRYLECELDRMVDGLGDNTLIIGRVVAAQVAPDVLRVEDREDSELVHGAPLLAYLHPGRVATIDRSQGFPFPAGFRR